MVKPVYNCSIDDLFLALNYGWELTEQNLPALAAYKSKYTPQYVKTNRADLRSAEDLPDQTARYAPTQSQRLDLVDKKEEVLDYFQFLVGYIEDAYPEAKVKIMTQAAGQGKYAKAQNNNWTSVKALLSSALAFIESNKAELSQNKNMPEDFLARFQKVRTDFDALYNTWNTEDSDSTTLTEEKIKANNAAYNAFAGVTSDAQKVYRKDAAMAQKFSFAALLSQVRGTSAAGVAGKVNEKGTKKGLADGTLTIESLGKSVQTDVNGRFDFSPIAAGFYTLKIEVAGYEPFVIEDFEIRTGAMRRLLIELQPVAAASPVLAMSI